MLTLRFQIYQKMLTLTIQNLPKNAHTEIFSNFIFGDKNWTFKTVCRTSVFQSYGTARYWTGEAKNKGKQKMRVWNARFWNATPRNATGLREKTKKEKNDKIPRFIHGFFNGKYFQILNTLIWEWIHLHLDT